MDNKKEDKTTDSILTEEVVYNNEINSEGLKQKKITLSHKNIYELAFAESCLHNAGLNISSSQLIRLCIDNALWSVHQKLAGILRKDNEK